MKTKQTYLRIMISFIWIIGILFPFYSIRHFSAEYKQAFDWLFHTHTSHVLMHAFLYGVMACLLSSFVPEHLCIRKGVAITSVLITILVMAICQEIIQTTCEQIRIGSDEFFDIFVDLAGGLLGISIYLKKKERKRRQWCITVTCLLVSAIVLIITYYSVISDQHASPETNISTATLYPAAVYYWGVGNPEAIPTSEILFFAGEAQLSNNRLSFSSVNLPESFSTNTSITAVFRFSQSILASMQRDHKNTRHHVEATLTRAKLMSKKLGREISLQIDGDCSIDQLNDYLSFVNLLKEEYGNKISITAVASWLMPSMVKKTIKSKLRIYYMLYTMQPAMNIKNWHGEAPLSSWRQATANLQTVLESSLLSANDITIVLPCYTLITVYDHNDKRISRNSEDEWLYRILAENSGNFVRSDLKREMAFGSISSWTVLRSGKYGPYILRAGSTVIREDFTLSDWRKAALEINKISANIDLGLFHCGGITE